MKAIARPVVIILLSFSFICSGIALYWSYKVKKQMASEPVKIYKLTELPNQRELSVEKAPAANSKVEASDASSQPPSTDSDPVEADSETSPETNSLESAAENGSEAATSSEDEADQQEARNDEEVPLTNILADKKAEVEQMLAEGDAALEQAMRSMNQAAPILISHLNTLSVEEQTAFLNTARSRMFIDSPPEVQEIMKANPEYQEQGWQLFLKILRENGYEPPNGRWKLNIFCSDNAKKPFWTEFYKKIKVLKA